MMFVSSGIASFLPIYMFRAADFPEEKGSIIFGAITLVAGIVGTITGSSLSSKYRARSTRAPALVCAAGLSLAMPFAVLAFVLAFKSHAAC